MSADVPGDDRPVEDPNPPTHYAAGWDTGPRRRGRVRLVVGVVVTVAAVTGASLVVGRFVEEGRTRPLPPDVTEPVDAYAVQLVTGSCLAGLPADGAVDRVRVVPCAQEHAAQVIGEYAFAPDAVWPGQDAAHARVARSCVLTDEEAQAGVEVVTWAPTREGWDDGDRSGLCLAVPPEPVTGSSSSVPVEG
ncbi:hypothetical protein AB6N23_12125 [Cellulomonas sp. 179-A 9B4 NHS]|uniref:hypothetical protein n=1 Tax=Cellulomonas sp. 179-A 9B4 NHS TaxID=3142379 RepID=UPI0039A21461